MTMPNFLIIGAPRCGTTSLYHYLKQHPQIYMSSIKEPTFFVLEGRSREFAPDRERGREGRTIYDLEAYQALFAAVIDEIAIGEASIQYLYSSRAPDRIKYHIPEAKLIAVLRDPAERAYSSYLMSVRRGLETITDFAQAIQVELDQPESGLKWWQKRRNLEAGFYHRHLQEYYERFDAQQIGVYFYEDLKADPARLVQDVFRFLGVDPSFSPDLAVEYLVSGTPKNGLGRSFLRLSRSPIKDLLKSVIPDRLGHRLVYAVESRILTKPPSLDPKIRADLIEIYRADILQLQDLLQRDLSHWLT